MYMDPLDALDKAILLLPQLLEEEKQQWRPIWRQMWKEYEERSVKNGQDLRRYTLRTEQSRKEGKNIMHGNCGEDSKYQLHKDVLDIQGSGVVRRDTDEKWQELKHSVRHVNIWPGCTALEDGLFAGWRLSSVDFPETLRTIGKCCFADSRVWNARLPAGVSLGDECFAGCTSLQIVNFLGTVQFGKNCFRDCGNLSSLSFGEDPDKAVWERMFGGCPGLVWREADAQLSFPDRAFEIVNTSWDEEPTAFSRFYVPKQYYYQFGYGSFQYTSEDLFFDIGCDTTLKMIGRFSRKGVWYRWA